MTAFVVLLPRRKCHHRPFALLTRGAPAEDITGGLGLCPAPRGGVGVELKRQLCPQQPSGSHRDRALPVLANEISPQGTKKTLQKSVKLVLLLYFLSKARVHVKASSL